MSVGPGIFLMEMVLKRFDAPAGAGAVFTSSKLNSTAAVRITQERAETGRSEGVM